jgi:hypothetical protein
MMRGGMKTCTAVNEEVELDRLRWTCDSLSSAVYGHFHQSGNCSANQQQYKPEE